MEKNLFPKRISIAATVLTFMFLVINSMLFYRLSSQFEEVYNTHFPILEMNAINVRFGESLSSFTNQLIYEYDNDLYIEYNMQKSSLDFNIQTYKLALKDSIHADSLPNDFSRRELNDLEEEIILLSKRGEKDKASKLFNSERYRKLDNQYKEVTQQIAEKLSIERDKVLKQKIEFFRLGVMFSLTFFIVLTILWSRVIILYRKNTLQKIKTEQELSEERIKSSHNAKMASLGEMAAGLAHEVNNPLAIISGYAEAMIMFARKEKPNVKRMEEISIKMLTTTYRISQIIKGLKSFSRDSSDDKFTPIPIIDILEETLVFCKEKFKSHGVTLQIAEKDKNLFIEARPVEISQVLLNLLNNSFDAITELDEKHQWIEIIIERIDNNMKLSVIDGGSGIDSEIAEKILEPFFTTKGVNKGTGLGLSISKNIINKHGGSFEIDLKHHHTKFDIEIPLSRNVSSLNIKSKAKAA